MERRKDEFRLLGDLARGRIVRRNDAAKVTYLVTGTEKGDAGRKISPQDVASLLASGAVSLVEDEIKLTSAGASALRRFKSGNTKFLDQHRNLAKAILPEGHDGPAPFVNAAESPLIWLRARKSKTGEPLIAPVEFEAGSRLAADFFAAGHQPRVTASWEPAGSPNRRRFGGRSNFDPTGSALDARQRLKHALESVGPDMARLLVDVCCLETGLTDIERRRNWPRRSARIVLRIGLGNLARHYGLTNERASDAVTDIARLVSGA